MLEVCGAVSYSVQLEDGRQVHRHIDQLRSRACKSCTRVQEDGQTPDERMSEYDVVNSGNAFTETRAVDPDTSELSTFASDTDSTPTPVPQPIEQEAHRAESDVVESAARLQHSVRVRHPPDRYGEKL